MTPEEALEGAIEILERDGWHQGGLHAGRTSDEYAAQHGPVCAMGALYRAAYGTCHAPSLARLARENPEAYAACHAAYDRLGVAARHLRVSVPAYNDLPTTTKEDIILLLKKAANGE